MRLSKQYQTLRLILGDQLNSNHSWFKQQDARILYVLAEMPSEVGYTKHHVQKVCAFFLAMQAFAEHLEQSGHHVVWLTLDETHLHATIEDCLAALIKRFKPSALEYQQPDEYRLSAALSSLDVGVSVTRCESEHFILPFSELTTYFSPKKSHLMESFYRKMRQKTQYLMENQKPIGGKWNFDAQNRQKITVKDLPGIPKPLCFENDATEVLKRLKRHNVETFGQADEYLRWPVTSQQAIELLDYFCEQGLPRFGQFQDAMTNQSEYAWSLYHSRVSFALNAKLLSPKEVIETALQAYEQSSGMISIAQIEGFVRQILGWREYIRGMYWVNMPEYQSLNFFNAQRALPEYFWTGQTKMACMNACLGQSLETSYAHHIQRLMVIGNFCLLAGIDPDQVDAWYLGVYIDAIEWVEMPNTRGMSQFSDGGLIATKPYCASGSYINKMSDYCKGCAYNVKEKTSDDACPFNALYWHFIDRNSEQLSKNPRMGMSYRTWNHRFDQQQRAAILKKAQIHLVQLENL